MDARTSKQQRRISRRQERHLAEDLGGRVQPASGALPGAKGDVRAMGVVRAEAKYTSKDSYSLKLQDLEKIIDEAGLERAVMQLCFMDRSNRPLASFAISPMTADAVSHPELLYASPLDRLYSGTKKSFLVRRDRLQVALLRATRVVVRFRSDPPQFFAIQNWGEYVSSMGA